MSIVDRILTIVITITLTSMAWIVAGGSLIEMASDKEGERSMRPAEAAPSPSPTPTAGQDSENEQSDDSGETTDAEDAGEVEPVSLNEPEPTPTTEIASGTLVVPVMNVRPSDLTDTFAGAATDGARPHEALDIMAPKGTSVIAASPGTVEKLHSSAVGGNTIYVRTTDRQTIHYYAHLDEYAKGLKEGQRVRRGQRLGAVGTSGNANEETPHLHFAILRTSAEAAWWEPAKAVNPYPLLTEGR